MKVFIIPPNMHMFDARRTHTRPMPCACKVFVQRRICSVAKLTPTSERFTQPACRQHIGIIVPGLGMFQGWAASRQNSKHACPRSCPRKVLGHPRAAVWPRSSREVPSAHKLSCASVFVLLYGQALGVGRNQRRSESDRTEDMLVFARSCSVYLPSSRSPEPECPQAQLGLFAVRSLSGGHLLGGGRAHRRVGGSCWCDPAGWAGTFGHAEELLGNVSKCQRAPIKRVDRICVV